MLSRSYGRTFLVAAAAFALLAWASGPVAAQQQAPFDCNAEINIELNPLGSFMPGTLVNVTLTLINGPTNDDTNTPAEQAYSLVEYFPSCTSTPCVIDPTLPVTFVGLTGNTCGVMVTPTPTGVPVGSQIDLTFTPDPLLLPPPPTTTGTSRCDLTFDVLIDPAAPIGGTFSMEAQSTAICFPNTPFALNTSASGTAEIVAVPTLGAVALGILVLALALGSWLILRRRSIHREAGI